MLQNSFTHAVGPATHEVRCAIVPIKALFITKSLACPIAQVYQIFAHAIIVDCRLAYNQTKNIYLMKTQQKSTVHVREGSFTLQKQIVYL